MPYGFPKSLGGDSKKNDSKLESMVSAIQRSGHSKVSAIKIAKASLEKSERMKQHTKGQREGG